LLLRRELALDNGLEMFAACGISIHLGGIRSRLSPPAGLELEFLKGLGRASDEDIYTMPTVFIFLQKLFKFLHLVEWLLVVGGVEFIKIHDRYHAVVL
jgi:hypothetical protein